MARFEVTMRDRSTEVVADADAYQQEGQMTTFFRTASDRQVVDTWSMRLASFRTSEVLAIRRVEVTPVASEPVTDPLTRPGPALVRSA